MSPEQFRQLADLFPDPALLLTRQGTVLAASQAVAGLGLAVADLTGRNLAELTASAAEKVRDYLRLCARSREPVVGALDFQLSTGQPVSCRVHGALVQHDPNGVQSRILLRLVRKGTTPFAALSAKIEELTEEMHRRQQAEQTLRGSEERLRLALEAGRMGVWDWNLRTDEVQWSDSVARVFGLSPGTFAGTFPAFRALVHPMDRERVDQAIAHALATRSSFDAEFRIVWPDHTIHWLASKGQVFCSEEDQAVRLVGVILDVTDHRRAEQDAQFLAGASAALARLVDYESTLQTVARLAVPFFADWCAVDLLEDDGTLRRVAVAHVDPAKVSLAHELHRRYPPLPDAPSGVWKILRTGQSELIAEITDDLLVTRVSDSELLSILRALGLRSYMGVPLSARGSVLGVITFIAAESGRRYDGHDLAVAEDLAHRAGAAIDNARLVDQLRDRDRRKDEFLALLGHELRNPLAPIRNALHLLELPGASAIADQARTMIRRQVEHLVRIVDDLLDVSRLMRGRIELRREAIPLGTILARAIETAQPQIAAAGHQLRVQVPDEPLWVHGDPVRLAQVVGNLLDNSIRYTYPGGQIELSAWRAGDQAVLSVRDNGIGIARSKQARIFELFVQGDRRSNDVQGGLGIGLSQVRGLVELHGGRVEVHSEGEGKGSTFLVHLPLLTPARARDSAAGAPRVAQRQAAVPRRVLVTDDNTDAAESLAMLLRLQGHQVRVTHDGPSALEAAQAEPPDVAFLDLGMPRMDGCEVARRFRAHPRLENVMLVALTGWGQPEDRRRTREAGFDHHLVKPVELDVLSQLLAEAG